MTKTKLLDLPAELLELMAKQCDKKDLKSLRHVCRELHAAADSSFIETFFKHRRHLVTKYSMETLVSITSVPRLRNQLKSLQLATTVELYASQHTLGPDVLLPGTSLSQYKKDVPVTVGKVLRRSLKEYNRNLRLAYNTSLEEIQQQLYGEDQVALKLAAEIFTNLRTAGLSATLSIIETDHNQPFGSRQIAEMLGLCPYKFTSTAPAIRPSKGPQPAITLLRAMMDTDLQVKGLELLGSGAGEALLAVIDEIPSLRQNLNCLVSLELNCSSMWIWALEEVEHLLSLLKSCVGLEKVSILEAWDDGTVVDFLGRVITVCSQHSLKSIKLEHSAITAKQAHRLLHAHEATLKSLTLSNVETSDGPGVQCAWSSLFTTMATTCSLTHLCLENVWIITGSIPDYIYVEGIEAVRERLQELASRENLFVPDD